MEGETYLSTGYGLRVAIETKARGWTRFDQLARVWTPSRLKGIQVSSEFGTPFLAAGQVYDVRPIPRKWLAIERTSDVQGRFVSAGTILVTCSGSVGRPTLAYSPHEGTLISHDLLRVEPKSGNDRGWLYGYLHSAQARAMTVGAHYGHIIKHLEPAHLDALPIPTVSDAVAADFNRSFDRLLARRNEGHRCTLEAEERFANALGPLRIVDSGEHGFAVRAAEALFSPRRRMEAAVHNPAVALIRQHLSKNGHGFITIRDAGYDVWVPGRYKRIPAPDGVIYRDSADLLEVSADLTKRFADCGFGDAFGGRVKSGWLLVPSSGQVYGIIGLALLATEALDDQVVSNHVIRAAPREDPEVRAGYLVTALSHPLLGRPLVKSLAFGSSVPEIDPTDFGSIEVVRLAPEEEDAIADLAEAAARARADADELERQLASDCSQIIEQFIVRG